MLRSDLLRSSWMFAVGALDAYFCDAYSDIVAATIISKSRHPAMALPDFFYEIKFPVRAIIEQYDNNANWRWRMAARRMMDRENVLSLKTIQALFNKFFRNGLRFFSQLMPHWIVHPHAKRRMFGITAKRYAGLSTPAESNAAHAAASEKLEDRMSSIFQRRHDCIHNCDRPRVSPQPIAAKDVVDSMIEDVEFLVYRCDEHVNSEFRAFLLGCGCPAAIVAQSGY